jgi:hypothetical protein
MCTGAAPLFVTTQKQDIDRLKAAAQPGQDGSPGDGDASMLLRRLKVYEFQPTSKRKEQIAKKKRVRALTTWFQDC